MSATLRERSRASNGANVSEAEEAHQATRRRMAACRKSPHAYPVTLPEGSDRRNVQRRERSRPAGVLGSLVNAPRKDRLVTDPGTLLGLSFRIFVAIALGAAIGLERQWRLRTAGIRTNALVSVGARLFVIMGAVGLGQDAGADPTRVAAQVVSGIGFLGAGVILRDGFDIRGLTTAATLWCAAAIGSLAGAGMEIMALIGCLAIIATNTLLRPLSRFVNGRQRREGSASARPEDDDAPTDYML